MPLKALYERQGLLAIDGTTATAATLVASSAEFTFRDIDDTQRIRVDSSFQKLIEVLPFGEGLDFDRHAHPTQDLT